jgi:hypothetical protein
MAECFNGEGVEFPSEEFPLHMVHSVVLNPESFEKLVKDNPLYSEKSTSERHTYKVWVFKKSCRSTYETQRRIVECTTPL